MACDFGCAVQAVMKDWNVRTWAAGLWCVKMALQPCMLCNKRTVIVEVIGSNEEGVCSAAAANLFMREAIGLCCPMKLEKSSAMGNDLPHRRGRRTSAL